MSNPTENGIDFLGIGVQKAASSWLWNILKEHDDIWMPPLKELHYFDRDICYPSPSFLFSKSLEERLKGQEPHNILFREKMISVTSQHLSANDFQKNQWLAKFFFGEYNDKWYLSLFTDGAEKLKGEITPSYSIINIEDIRKIKNLFPHLKIILVLRDPVERAWSQTRFYMTHNKLSLDSSISKIKKFIDSPVQSARGNYKKILQNWEAVFPKEQIYIGFHSDIINDSENFIQSVSDFLGIDYRKIITSNTLHKKFNTSLKLELPLEIDKYLNAKYSEDKKYLNTRFGRFK